MFVSQSAIKMAPPFSLVSKFFIGACFYLFCIILLLPFKLFGSNLQDFSYAGVLHLYLLGFVMMVIVGALYQLIPVVLEKEIFTLKFANSVFWLLFIGVMFFCFGMIFVKVEFFYIGASCVYLALFYFAIIYLLSFIGIEKLNFIRIVLFFAGICLLVGLCFGLALVLGFLGIINEFNNLIHLHVLFSLGGFVYFIILGVSLVLIPMFALSHKFKDTFAKLSFIFMIIAMIFSFYSINFMLIFIALSVLFYIMQCILVMRKRVRKQKDYWFYNIMASFLFLALSLVFVALSFVKQNLLEVSVVMVLFGFLYHFILGHLYKILPFLIWYKYISVHVGKKKVPLLAQMIHTKVANMQTYTSFFSIILMSVAVAFEDRFFALYGGGLFAISAILLLYNVYYAFSFRNFKDKIW